MSNTSDFRLLLQANGYAPVPIKRGEKYPPMNGWPNLADATADDIRAWDARYPDAPGTGIILGKVGMLDVDIYDAAAAEAVRELARGWLQDVGKVLIRTGQPPKCGLLFRTETPFTKKRYEYEGGHALELLGLGQQAVIDAIHPKTGKPYEFEHGITPTEIPANELPLLSEARATELLDLLDEVLRTQFDFVRLDTAKRTAPQANGHDATAAAHMTVKLCASPTVSVWTSKPPSRPCRRAVPGLMNISRRLSAPRSWKDGRSALFAPKLRNAPSPSPAPLVCPGRWRRSCPQSRGGSSVVYNGSTGKTRTPAGIPDWLPEELHEGWAKMLAEGHRPILHHNRYGICVSRAAHHASKERAATEPQPSASDAPAKPIFTSRRKRKSALFRSGHSTRANYRRERSCTACIISAANALAASARTAPANQRWVLPKP